MGCLALRTRSEKRRDPAGHPSPRPPGVGQGLGLHRPAESDGTGQRAGGIDSFDRKCERLRSFLARWPASHLRSSTVVDGYKLGRWVENVRRRYHHGLLRPERIDRFESIPGWEWATGQRPPKAREATRRNQQTFYDERAGLLRRFLEKQGWERLRADTVFEGVALGSWVTRARALCERGRPPRALLDALASVPGWSDRPQVTRKPGIHKGDVRLFGLTRAERRRRIYSRHLEALTRFLAVHGWSGLKPSTRYAGLRLGRWVGSCRTRQGTDTIDPWLRDQLEAIDGFRWAPPQRERREEIIRALTLLVTEKGWTALDSRPRHGDVDLRAWVFELRRTHRRGRVSARVRALVEAIPGWPWVDDPARRGRSGGRGRRRRGVLHAADHQTEDIKTEAR
ncbi:MAG: helicase associated domain-containing protein [Candidatus Riflebacteria bacterium]|nr:helicase associated domain-containing protein [Candidatus Riflebacteria bacterium]